MRRGLVGLVAAVFALVVSGCAGGDDPAAGGTSTPTPAASSAEQAPATTTSPQTLKAQPMANLDQATLDRRLIAAAWRNDVRAARRLIAAGADVNAKDDTVQSAYLIATSEGYPRLLDLTVRHGADVHSLDSFNGTGLIRAADRGHGAVIGRLIREGVNVDHVNRLGWTALHEAIILGDGSARYVESVRLLVAGGADVSLPSQRDGVRPLDHATSLGFDRITATLVAAERATGMSSGQARNLLIEGARDGDPDRVAIALRAGADIESRDSERRTPLLLAAINDHVEVARLLVMLGADPDAQDYRADSAWLVTGVTGSVPMLEALLPAGPDQKLRNRFGGISVIPASERGHVEYVRRVVREDIDVNHVNDLGWTALLEAVILGDGGERHQRVVRILLDAGANPELADRDGVTPLEHAQSRGYDEIVRLIEAATTARPAGRS